jgi:outer membrane lipoprotein SlyB
MRSAVVALILAILLTGCAARQVVRDDALEPEYCQAWRQDAPPKPAEDSKTVKALKIGGWVALGAVVIAGAVVIGTVAHALGSYT